MALSGLEIYKNLPKTNCKECGFPTCLAFAMKLAQKGAELSACPYVSEEAKAALEAASKPPIRLVTIGAGDRKIEVGNEVVLFRHEKTFVHEPGLVIRVKDSDGADAISKVAQEVAAYEVERVGRKMVVAGIAIENASKDVSTFAKAASAVRESGDLAIVLMTTDPAAMEAALKVVGNQKPLIYAATADNIDAMAKLALDYKCPIAVYEPKGLSELAELTEKLSKAGIEDIVLDPGARGFADSLAALTQLRRLALRKNFRPLGFPIITFPGEGTSSAEEEAILAAQHVAKYAGVIVLDRFSAAEVYPLLTLSQNAYTDPQKPIQVQPGIYQIGTPNSDSPIMVTSNFSLTYFTVSGEIEGSGVASWLIVCDTEGLSVLTGWAAGKFDAEKISKTVKSVGIEDKVNHKKIIIPGFVASLSGELEDELAGWTIMVGSREAVDIPAYLKRFWLNN